MTDVAFFSVGGCTLLLALRCAHLHFNRYQWMTIIIIVHYYNVNKCHLFVSSVTVWFLVPLAVFLKLVIDQHVLVCRAVLTLLR